MSPMNARELRSLIEGTWRRVFGEFPVLKQRPLPDTGEPSWCIDSWLFLVPSADGGCDLAVYLASPLAAQDRPCVRGLHGSREHYSSLWLALILAMERHAHRKGHDAIDAWAQEHHCVTETSHRPYGQPGAAESN